MDHQSLRICAATAEDVGEIAAIHLVAFDSNPLLHAQFPTPSSLTALRHYLSQEMLTSIQEGENCGKAVIVAKDHDDKIISFAKWDLPNIQPLDQNDDDPTGTRITSVEGCKPEYLERYTAKAEAAMERVTGNGPCYRLTFVATLPDHRGQGAGTLLTQWGLNRAKEEAKQVYLESTLSAVPLYRRLGFRAMDGFSIRLLCDEPPEKEPIYEEVCMLRTWDTPDVSSFEYWDSSLSITSLRQDYEAGIRPQQVIEAIYERIDTYKLVQPSVWLHLEPLSEVLQAANELLFRWPDPNSRPPLWGIPFSVKDSVDVVKHRTTMGCPPLAYVPGSSANIYLSCIDEGGIFIGKTNMEQLATGMTGCRSPYGTLHSTFSKLHCVGGSSSGSAVSVSEGLVSFSIGSDTAGSIRVPALFNGLVGFKPTKGTVSARGIAPACLHQDCVSFLTTSIEDAETVWDVCKGFDPRDIFAKLPSQPQMVGPKQQLRASFGVPPDLALDACSPFYRRQFSQAVDIITKNGIELVELDWQPFAAANELLYNSSFVTERLTILPDGWFNQNKDLLHPVTKLVFEGALARESTAVDLFKDLHKQAEYKRAVEGILRLDKDVEEGIDELTIMIVPTTPFHPTIEEVSRDPVGINGQLGTFAHFANVLDLVAVAVPCGTYGPEGESGGRLTRLPFGITILAGAGLDKHLLDVAARIEEVLGDMGGQDEK